MYKQRILMGILLHKSTVSFTCGPCMFFNLQERSKRSCLSCRFSCRDSISSRYRNIVSRGQRVSVGVFTKSWMLSWTSRSQSVRKPQEAGHASISWDGKELGQIVYSEEASGSTVGSRCTQISLWSKGCELHLNKIRYTELLKLHVSLTGLHSPG